MFSLDAFVALMLILLAINSAIALSSVPKGYYSSLEQAHDLAKDTLHSMQAAKYPYYSEKFTYVDIVLMGGADRLDAISKSAEKAIPVQFGYRFDRFNALTNTWETLYDSALDSTSARSGKVQRKLSASYRLFFSSYDVSPNRGESPFCYKSCSGVPEMPPEEGGDITDVQAANAQIGGQQYSAPLGMHFDGEIQGQQANLPNVEADVGGVGQADPGPFESNGVGLGNTGVAIGAAQAQKFCMSPCDVPRSLYGDGTPFIGQLRLTVYS